MVALGKQLCVGIAVGQGIVVSAAVHQVDRLELHTGDIGRLFPRAGDGMVVLPGVGFIEIAVFIRWIGHGYIHIMANGLAAVVEAKQTHLLSPPFGMWHSATGRAPVAA